MIHILFLFICTCVICHDRDSPVYPFAIFTIGLFTEDVNLDCFDDKYWK